MPRKNKGKGKVVREFPALEVPPSAGDDDEQDIRAVLQKLAIATRENERMKERLGAIDEREKVARENAEWMRKFEQESEAQRLAIAIAMDRELAEKKNKAHADYDGRFGHICTDCFEPIVEGKGCIVGCGWHCSKECYRRARFFKDCGDYQHRITEYPQMKIDFRRISDELAKEGCLKHGKYGVSIDWERVYHLDGNTSSHWENLARECEELERRIEKEINELCYCASTCRECGREYCAKSSHGASANWNECPKCCECCNHY